MTQLLVPKSPYVWKKLGGWGCGSEQAPLKIFLLSWRSSDALKSSNFLHNHLISHFKPNIDTDASLSHCMLQSCITIKLLCKFQALLYHDMFLLSVRSSNALYSSNFLHKNFTSSLSPNIENIQWLTDASLSQCLLQNLLQCIIHAVCCQAIL